jgi:hypothetical protein
MTEFHIENKIQSAPKETGRFQGGRFDQEFLSTRGDGYPIIAIEVWNEQKRFFPTEIKNERVPARVILMGLPCKVLKVVNGAIYGQWVVNGNVTSNILEATYKGVEMLSW